MMDDGTTPAALHLNKSLYGLVQSSRLLHKRLSKFLIERGFKQLVSDQCVFIKGSGDNEVVICTWVDDIIMATKRRNKADRQLFDKEIRSVVHCFTVDCRRSWLDTEHESSSGLG